MIVVDESQRINNPSAKRTQRILGLAELAVSRRIASGTLVANTPLDLFSQYEFLSPGLLGTRSYRAFVAEYAELLPPGHPLLSHIGGRGTPQIVKRDAKGNPIFRNTQKLSALMSPHTFRVTKEQCLDLPEKIYQTHYFDLAPAQRRVYDKLKTELVWFRDDGEIDIFNALTIINKLRQITSGFILVDGSATQLKESAPRMAALTDIVEDTEGQIIVWASFREELRQIAHELKDFGVVEYHGGISSKAREEAVDQFQSGAARIFVGNPASAGVGLTLTAANTVIYHSCSYSLEERLQSEDRCHRIGTRRPVVYIDLVARGTIDEKIADSLQNKKQIAADIVNNL
jgi:SNF2 family DNA or RNA helicase